MLAFMQATAETRLMASLRSPELSVKVWEALRAEALFPFSPAIREVNAHQAVSALGMPPLIGLLTLRRALAQAPNNPALLLKLIAARLAMGDGQGARETAELFVARFPRLPETEQLRNVMKGLGR